jgi:LytR cell envelope-related transcriptional attenuator/Protein of unknown function (DUF2510)
MSDRDNSVPPCWAVDPSGRHRFRYWDGTAWTGHVFDGEVPPATAPGPPRTESPPQPAGTVLPSESARTQYVVEPEDEHRGEPGDQTTSLEHRPPRARRAFWMGVLVGGCGVAVLAAIAWVTLGDNSSDTKVATPATTTTTRKTTTTTLAPSSSVATSTTLAARPPAEVRVEVLNASGKAGAAGSEATTLKNAGYTIAGVGDATARQGTVVACKPGFEAEATALAQAVGSGATTEPFPTPPPTGSENADCVVTLGT